MERLPPPPLSATSAEAPEPPRWVLGLRRTRRETNWEAQAIGFCVFVVSMATLFAAIRVMSCLVRPGF